MQTSITYRFPGGVSATYRGEMMSRSRWLRHTWIGGWALWCVWFRCARMLVAHGVYPSPRLVGNLMCIVLRTGFDRLRHPEKW